MMSISPSPRDQQVLRGLSALNQAATTHIKRLYFHDVNRISMDRSLERLTKHGFIVRIGRRNTGTAGAPPAVYQLGPRGWTYMRRTGLYKRREVFEHTLCVADIYVATVEMHRAGLIVIDPESDLEHTVGHLRADYYLVADVPAINKRRRFYVEVQRSMRKGDVTQKIDNYFDAFKMTPGGQFFPRVVIVVRDHHDRLTVQRWIPADRRKLFSVMLFDEFLAEIVKAPLNANMTRPDDAGAGHA